MVDKGVAKMNILAISWDEIQSSLLALADKISASGYRPDMIVGIARGGWVVARVLSDLLEVNDLASVKISLYSGPEEKSKVPVIAQPISESPKGKRVLIADDVADSGESLMLARRHILDQGAREIRISTIHLKPWSKVTPDYYVSTTESWILYPWELRETLSHLIRIWGKEVDNPSTLRKRLIGAGIPEGIVDRYVGNSLQNGGVR